jgi:hypothetical protein
MTDEYCVEDLRDIAEGYIGYDYISDEKFDFDKALNSIGKGHWQGIDSIDFSDYKHFGRLQRVVIADILGIEDEELEKLKFTRVQNLKAIAYRRMLDILCDEN